MNKQRLYFCSLAHRAAIVALGLALASSINLSAAYAQDSGDDIENLFNKEEEPAAPEVNEAPSAAKAPPADIKEVKDLNKLSEFKDVAVIQKRYLPKTGRFEFYVGPAVILNEAFFLNFGLSGRFAYYFTERYGFELAYTGLTTSERQVTTDLREKRRVTTTSLVTPKSYMGADFKWTPIYGKMSWRNKKITPFDMYFSLGGGMTATNQGSSEPTVHFGTGQVFALSKSTAVRWDFSWNMFNSTSSAATSNSSSLYNNLLITIGMSFFFPEATYR